jgi:acetoin utilization deacetylase AcuC-like enzyme
VGGSRTTRDSRLAIVTGVFTHPACLEHEVAPGHPESPRRLGVLLERLRADGRFAIHQAAPAAREAILAAHPEHYLRHLEETAKRGGGVLDPDTAMNRHSWDAALGAAGAVLAAVQSALDGTPGFAAVRPPGHHALADRAMGFCLLGNVVIGARAAQGAGRERVLIVDWDVHHGNGTQALVERDPSIRFVSLHQWPAYPGTGRAEERGVGNVFNVPMPPGRPPEEYVEGLWQAVLAAGRDWQPSLILISAGFDAMKGDPLAGFTLEPEHYADLTTRLLDQFPGVPIAAALEGGYVPSRLADGVLAHLGALAASR